jgi:capsule polysaccharide export protein KpsE/RkpR
MPFGIQLLIAFAVGCLLIAIIWWLGRRQSKGVIALANSSESFGQEGLIAELRQQITQRETELRSEREQANANAARLEKRNGELEAELKSLNERLMTE